MALGTLHVFRSASHLLTVFIKVMASAAILDSGPGIVLIVVKRNGSAGVLPKSTVIDNLNVFLRKPGKRHQDNSNQNSGQKS
jgi:hypothetical protein